MEKLEHRMLLNADVPQIVTVETSLNELESISPERIAEIQTLSYAGFRHLTPPEVVHLTEDQIASIPNDWELSRFRQDTRDTLTRIQIQALHVAQTGIRRLNSEQIEFLTFEQIQSLSHDQFRYLTASRIVLLKTEQISTIENDWEFSQISEEARSRLKIHHVRALDVMNVGIRRLTNEQISYLTVRQIRSLDSDQFRYLHAQQTQFLTPQQITTIANDWEFSQINDEARAAIPNYSLRQLDTKEVGIRRLTRSQIDGLGAHQIRALHYSQFRYLGPEQTALLTGTQIASIPNSWDFAQIKAEARAAIPSNPLHNLKVEVTGIKLLTPEQIGWLLPRQIRNLDKSQFRYLSGNESKLLTADQIATLEHAGEFARMSDEARANLSTWALRHLNVAKVGIDRLTPEQISLLLPRQIRALQSNQFRYLGPEEVFWLTREQLASVTSGWEFARMSDEARAAIRIGPIRSLSVDKVGIANLTDEQINWLVAPQVRSLESTQFRYLPPNQARLLSADQIATVSNGWEFAQMSDEARAAIRSGPIRSLNVAEVGISKLTAEQISWLLPRQVRSLPYHQFRYLDANQAALLSATQVGTIPNGWEFSRMSDAARAAIRQGPLSMLNVADVGISRLTEEQIDWLFPRQVRSIDFSQFHFLGADQTALLTAEQIGSIPDSWWFTRMSEDARAALTETQVTHVDTSNVSIKYLAGRLRQHLTPRQIALLEAYDFRFLTEDQVPHLSQEQMASIDDDWHIRKMLDESVAALSREQLLSLQPGVSAELSGLPKSFIAPMPEPMSEPMVAGDGLANDPRTQMEKMNLLNLVPRKNVDVFTVTSGLWSDPAIWHNGDLPDPGDDVLVSAGTKVTFNDVMLDPIYTLRIDGHLRFKTNIDTQLKADTIVVNTNGVLQVGTKAAPIDADVAARIVFTADTPIDTDWDPRKMSRGLLSRGRVRMIGQEVSPFVALSVNPSIGDTQLQLAESVINWNVGDRLVLTGTNPNIEHHQDEELEIVAINGNTVTIDRPLEFDHHPPEGFGLSVYVANFNRNVVVMSENPEVTEQRGHVMLMHNPNVILENAGFYGLGRQDKRNPVNSSVLDDNGKLIENTGLNPRGRYAVHMHRQGVRPDQQAAIIRGSAVVDSPGWGFVNHSSNVHIEDNVAFHVVGASFVTEDGNEIGSFKRNLSIYTPGSGDGIESRRDLHDFGHEGNGFWFQGPGVDVVDNVAASSAEGAFVFFTASEKALFDAVNLDDPSLAGGRDQVPVGVVPLKQVSGNVAFASKRGLETWFHMTHMNDGQTVIEDFTSWNTSSNGIFTPYTGRTTLKDATVLGNLRRPGGTGIGRNDVTNNMTYDNVEVRGFGVGISVPVNRATVIRDGEFETIRALDIRSARDTIRTVDIVGAPTFDTLTESQLRGKQQYDVHMSGEIDMQNHDLETFFSPDIVRIGTIKFNNHQIYYHKQANDFVPFANNAELPSFIPNEIKDKTNEQLWSEFGIAPAGTIAPTDAVEVDRINGLVGSRTEYRDDLEMVSRKYTNQLNDYVLQYKDEFGDTISDPNSIDLVEGWNLITRQINNETRTFFVFGDTQAPTFTVNDPESLVVNPEGLEFGFVLRGTVFDNSFGHKSFRKKFEDLEEREILTRADGSQYIELRLQIKDLAGNTTDVLLELNLDPDAPLVPGTEQRDLPQREMPETLQELIEYYLLTGQSDLLDTLIGG